MGGFISGVISGIICYKFRKEIIQKLKELKDEYYENKK